MSLPDPRQEHSSAIKIQNNLTSNFIIHFPRLHLLFMTLPRWVLKIPIKKNLHYYYHYVIIIILKWFYKIQSFYWIQVLKGMIRVTGLVTRVTGLSPRLQNSNSLRNSSKKHSCPPPPPWPMIFRLWHRGFKFDPWSGGRRGARSYFTSPSLASRVRLLLKQLRASRSDTLSESDKQLRTPPSIASRVR